MLLWHSGRTLEYRCFTIFSLEGTLAALENAKGYSFATSVAIGLTRCQPYCLLTTQTSVAQLRCRDLDVYLDRVLLLMSSVCGCTLIGGDADLFKD